MKIKSVVLLVFTAVATAAINYSLMPTPFVFFIVFVLLSHEFGHYFSALLYKAQPDLPYIIPLPLIAIGITRVNKFNSLTPKVRKSILLNGPLFGVTTSLIIFLYLLINPIISPMYMLVITLIEFILNYFGSDGLKYRRISKQELSCTF
jgi:hypothetical protein